MQLDEYIKETIVQIAKGVNSASQEVSELGGTVNPVRIKSTLHGDSYRKKAPPQNIKFEVALQVKEVEGSDVNAGVKLSVFSVGGKTNQNAETGALHKVNFEVPVDLPEFLEKK